MSLYKKLLKAGCSVLAFDYRGFADSTDITDINETTLVHDATVALQYVRWVVIICFLKDRAIYFDSRRELGRTKVLVWAHSMGAWVSGHMMATYDLSSFERIRLILEAPTNHVEDEMVASKGCFRKSLLRCFGDPNSEFR